MKKSFQISVTTGVTEGQIRNFQHFFTKKILTSHRTDKDSHADDWT